MKSFFFKITLFLILLSFYGCQQNNSNSNATLASQKNEIQFAKGLEIYKYKGYSIVIITNPWPNAKENFTYVLQEKNGIVPDSLKKFNTIQIPIKSIVVTSTTHIPALEMLGVETTLIGFPNTDYISSEKTRKRIDSGKVREVGTNETLNTEVLIDMAPDLIVSFGLNNSNPTLDNLQKSGLKVMLNGDWTEQSPLGKAEWIKFFGALYGLDSKANTLFSEIENEYSTTLAIAKKATSRPTVLSGAMFQDQWYVPQGESWAALFLRDAQSNYLWNDSKGTGSLTLPFETILEKAQNAEFWVAPGDFSSLKQMSESNPHYNEFASFKNKKVYSYSINKGAKGGILYFEWSPTRPDWVLKDLIKIFHPELLPNHKLFFFQKLE
ncbi:iron complex transport system substrate-binding protein [Flavobacterium fryxellicola]|uniref:ABC transporter substrate-binding protein n=1 Tax=Flavobacterium fryxellicola TaxID=249352 RepID=A0A167XZG2_9FLAO|nr:ABC transporter substrate-binding protein [Flavobacterium fryxellicola]OAB28857.1 ABC transporter substrate-binding protein [Flavobacterium fryxellicola]SHN60987.1 iron complex transport system substrate-binding protein [Flavobacterium fryxellicola]